FRQFALVIAATAIISALNALTLNPVQCALYLRPVDPDRRVNRLYRRFNRIYAAVEARYVALVSYLVHHLREMVVLFLAVVGVAAIPFARHPPPLPPPTPRVPPPRGSGLLHRRGPAAARRRAAAGAPAGREHRRGPRPDPRREGLGDERGILRARL